MFMLYSVGGVPKQWHYAPILFPEISLFSFSLYFPTHTNPQIPIEFKRGSNVEDITLPLLVSQSHMHLRHRAMWTSPVPWASRRGFWRQDQKESLILSDIGIKVSYKYPPATTIFAMCPDMSEHLCANGLCVFPSQIYALSIINLTAYQTSLCGCSPSNSNSNTNKLIICPLYSAMNTPSILGFPIPINDTSGSSQEKIWDSARLDLSFSHLCLIHNKFLFINSEICPKWNHLKCVYLKSICLMINFLMIFFTTNSELGITN